MLGKNGLEAICTCRSTSNLVQQHSLGNEELTRTLVPMWLKESAGRHIYKQCPIPGNPACAQKLEALAATDFQPGQCICVCQNIALLSNVRFVGIVALCCFHAQAQAQADDWPHVGALQVAAITPNTRRSPTII